MNILHSIQEGRLTGVVKSCEGTDFCNTLLKESKTGREDEEKDLSTYLMTLRQRANGEN